MYRLWQMMIVSVLLVGGHGVQAGLIWEVPLIGDQRVVLGGEDVLVISDFGEGEVFASRLDGENTGHAGDDGEKGKEGGEKVEVRASKEVVAWLDKLEKKGGDLRTFESRVVHVREQILLGDSQSRMGVVYLVREKDKSKFAINFSALIKDDGKLIQQKRLFIFDGEWLIEKDFERKMYIKRQVVEPGKKFDPLKLGEGPFPLPVGQKRKDILAMFDVKLIKDKPVKDSKGNVAPERLHLELRPRKDVPELTKEMKFKKLDLWYDMKTLLPLRVETTDGKNTTRVRLMGAKVNGLAKDKEKQLFDVTPPKKSEGWDVVIKPFGK